MLYVSKGIPEKGGLREIFISTSTMPVEEV